jgi:hypothetical protein
MDPISAGIGLAALVLSVYNALQARRRDQRDAARDFANLRLTVTNIENRHTGDVYGVAVRVSNPGHRPIEIRGYEVSDRHGETLNIVASGIPELPTTLGDGQGLDFCFDLDDLQTASQQAQAMPEIFRVTDAHGTPYATGLPGWNAGLDLH